MSICENNPGCTGFHHVGGSGVVSDGGGLHSFATNTSRISYMSYTTCGAVGEATISSGTACSPAGTQYIICPASTDAYFRAYESTDPLAAEQNCDSDPTCAGFMLTIDQTDGWLLAYAAGGYSQQYAFRDVIRLVELATLLQVVI